MIDSHMTAEANPFVYNHPIDPPDLINREAEATLLVELAQEGNHGRVTAPRRYGKTSLLRKVLLDCDHLGMPTAYVDLFGVQTIEDVLQRIESSYKSSFHGRFRKAAELLIRSIQPQVTLSAEGASLGLSVSSDQRQALDRLQSFLDLPVRMFEKSGVRAVVVFDEFQNLLAANEKIDGFFRSRIQLQVHEATYLFAGSHAGMMRALFADRERPFFGQARPIVLKPLSSSDLAGYIGERFAETGKDSGIALAPLLDLVAGHPQRAMLLANRLWSQTQRGAAADEETFAAAFAGVMADQSEAFELEWRRLSATDRGFVSALAANESPYAKKSAEKHGLARGSAAASSIRLLDESVIGGEDGEYQLIDPLFAVWVRSLRG